MEIAALVILILSFGLGFFAIFYTNFGTFLMLLGSAAYAFMTGFTIVNWTHLSIIFFLYILGEAGEFLFTIVGAKKFGASNRAVIGAVVGGILGAVLGTFFLGAGIIVGTFLGVFFGAFIVEYITHRDFIRSIKSGTGGLVGRIGSIIIKMLIALLMLALLIAQIVA